MTTIGLAYSARFSGYLSSFVRDPAPVQQPAPAGTVSILANLTCVHLQHPDTFLPARNLLRHPSESAASFASRLQKLQSAWQFIALCNSVTTTLFLSQQVCGTPHYQATSPRDLS
ncbi:hypothetical protein VTH06DRAFT_2619 [Thermothelomyces fergusii]